MLRPVAALAEREHEDENDSGGEWHGISETSVPPVDHEAEYIDEEKYTTVTVESMDVSKEGLLKAQEDRNEPESGEDGQVAADTKDAPPEKQKKPWTKDKPKDGSKKRKKSRNFRYESKVDRKDARSRQKARNSKQARDRRAGES